MSVDFHLVGQRIKAKRLAKRLTQDNLAELLSVSVGYVSQVERGVTRVNLETLSEIALHLDCDLPDLIADVIPQRDNYLQHELSQVAHNMNEAQMNMLLDIARIISKYGAPPFPSP